MAGIVAPMRDILAKLKSHIITNGDGSQATPYVRVWNDQIKYDKEGILESFPKPAFFLQPMSPMTFEVIGQGMRSCDVNWRIHIATEQYNADDGTYEQDLEVFELRDAALALLTYFNPTGCGPMTCVTEEQDFGHDNLYHYIMDFPCNFTDSKGSRLDELRNFFVTKQPPTDLETTGVIAGAGPILAQQEFRIPQR